MIYNYKINLFKQINCKPLLQNDTIRIKKNSYTENIINKQSIMVSLFSIKKYNTYCIPTGLCFMIEKINH